MIVTALLCGIAQITPAQSALPVAQPTSLTSPAADAKAASPGPAPTSKVEVTYASGQLTVDATNVGLNQLLREIAQKTGMHISGGVADDRVFGHYGPSPVAEVLASLLDGTGGNMLLVDNHNGPPELILTPRRGGATPPSANAGMAQNDNRDQPQEQQYVPPIRPFQPPIATGRGPVGANPDGSPNFQPPSQNDANGTSSADGPKTPQQIYDQLQSLGAQHPTPPEQ